MLLSFQQILNPPSTECLVLHKRVPWHFPTKSKCYHGNASLQFMTSLIMYNITIIQGILQHHIPVLWPGLWCFKKKTTDTDACNITCKIAVQRIPDNRNGIWQEAAPACADHLKNCDPGCKYSLPVQLFCPNMKKTYLILIQNSASIACFSPCFPTRNKFYHGNASLQFLLSLINCFLQFLGLQSLLTQLCLGFSACHKMYFFSQKPSKYPPDTIGVHLCKPTSYNPSTLRLTPVLAYKLYYDSIMQAFCIQTTKPFGEVTLSFSSQIILAVQPSLSPQDLTGVIQNLIFGLDLKLQLLNLLIKKATLL